MTARRRPRSGRHTPAQPVRATAPPLYRSSVWLFLAFTCAAFVAFWPGYFSRLDRQPTYHPHAHGLAMTAWCLLLITQAVLIRSGRRKLHAQLGALSYGLVPVMILTTVNFVNFRMHGVRELGHVGLYSLALMLNSLALFVVLYGLAIYHRRRPAVHARYMICTIFPLLTPVTDRITAVHFPSIIPLLLRIDGVPILPVVGFTIADIMLVALSVWDWRTNRRVDAFPVALALTLLCHVSILTFYQFGFWDAFGTWFAALPLS